MAVSFDRFRDFALLVWRVGVGTFFLLHGWPKLAGGAEKWAKLGAAMKHLGVDFAPTAWGLAAALSEGLGGLLLIVGLLVRPAAAALFFTMVVAARLHIARGEGWLEASHAAENAFAFFAIFVLGPGRYSLDARVRGVG